MYNLKVSHEKKILTQFINACNIEGGTTFTSFRNTKTLIAVAWKAQQLTLNSSAPNYGPVDRNIMQ
jgi:hypothetical protein